MKADKPILFSTAMVQAIIADNKTQTRRIIKPQPDPDGLVKLKDKNIYQDTSERNYKPYAVPGMVLWVRETWRNDTAAGKFLYKADNIHAPVTWKPSIFMPRAACRLFLEVTNIRAERLQNITAQDILSEGIPLYMGKSFTLQKHEYVPGLHTKWIELWDSINAARGYSWESNPWVWVIEFKKL